jgi:hypothetical protein
MHEQGSAGHAVEHSGGAPSSCCQMGTLRRVDCLARCASGLLCSMCKQLIRRLTASMCRNHCAMHEHGSDGAGYWKACGEACVRLDCASLAKLAFEKACAASPFSLSSHLALANLHALEGSVKETFAHLTEVLLHMDVQHPLRPLYAVSSSVLAAVSVVINAAGMRAVQEEIEDAVGRRVHRSLEMTAELAFERGTDGCSE